MIYHCRTDDSAGEGNVCAIAILIDRRDSEWLHSGFQKAEFLTASCAGEDIAVE
jgi:hypothetical protein